MQAFAIPPPPPFFADLGMSLSQALIRAARSPRALHLSQIPILFRRISSRSAAAVGGVR